MIENYVYNFIILFIISITQGESMLATLHSIFISLKSALFHLTSHPNSQRVPFHQSGNSSKQQFIKAAIHRMAFSSNAQAHLIFKTVSKIFLGLLVHKLCMIY